jgi:rubredoxin
VIECAMCRLEFDPSAPGADQVCGACSLVGTGCGKTKCPRCGYENPRPLPDAREAFRTFWRTLTHAAPK